MSSIIELSSNKEESLTNSEKKIIDAHELLSLNTKLLLAFIEKQQLLESAQGNLQKQYEGTWERIV